MSPLFVPIVRAVSQLDDPVFGGVVVRSLAWALPRTRDCAFEHVEQIALIVNAFR